MMCKMHMKMRGKNVNAHEGIPKEHTFEILFLSLIYIKKKN